MSALPDQELLMNDGKFMERFLATQSASSKPSGWREKLARKRQVDAGDEVAHTSIIAVERNDRARLQRGAWGHASVMARSRPTTENICRTHSW
jgi:hypothetical protein